jgi:hypothetical protein
MGASQITYCWSSISSPMRTNEEGCSLCGNELLALASRASASASFRLAALKLAAINEGGSSFSIVQKEHGQ